MKKYSKIISVLLVVMMTIMMFTTVFATYTPGSVKPQGDTTQVQKLGETIFGIIQVVGTISAVAILIILGIKYMLGSAEEKAEYKKTLLPYIIGAAFVFAASNIAQLIYTWSNANLK